MTCTINYYISYLCIIHYPEPRDGTQHLQVGACRHHHPFLRQAHSQCDGHRYDRYGRQGRSVNRTFFLLKKKMLLRLLLRLLGIFRSPYFFIHFLVKKNSSFLAMTFYLVFFNILSK